MQLNYKDKKYKFNAYMQAIFKDKLFKVT
jgi:hypothetical protein